MNIKDDSILPKIVSFFTYQGRDLKRTTIDSTQMRIIQQFFKQTI